VWETDGAGLKIERGRVGDGRKTGNVKGEKPAFSRKSKQILKVEGRMTSWEGE